MTRLPFIPAQTIKVSTASRADLAQFVIGGVYIAPGTSAGRVRVWKVNIATLTDGGEIIFPNEAGKDDSVALEILTTGDLLISISEALPGGAGATAGLAVYRVLGVFPAQAAPGSSTTDTLARAQIAALSTQVNKHLKP